MIPRQRHNIIITKPATVILLIIVWGVLASCSQYGCPGGMCAPDHYYSSPKHGLRKTLSSRTNKARHVNYGRYNRQLVRQAKYRERKSDKLLKRNTNKWNTNYRKASLKTNIENGGFKNPKTKAPDNKALFKAEGYTEPKRRKKGEGLWPPEIQNYHSKLPDKKKKVNDTAKKKGKGVKKIK